MKPSKVITRHEERDSFLQFHILRFMIKQQMLRRNDSLHLLIPTLFRIVRKAMIHRLEPMLIEADTWRKWQLKVGKQNRFNYCISTWYLQWIFLPSVRRSTIPRIELHSFTADLQAVQSRNPQRFAPQSRRIGQVRLGLYQRKRGRTLSFVHLGDILWFFIGVEKHENEWIIIGPTRIIIIALAQVVFH